MNVDNYTGPHKEALIAWANRWNSDLPPAKPKPAVKTVAKPITLAEVQRKTDNLLKMHDDIARRRLIELAQKQGGNLPDMFTDERKSIGGWDAIRKCWIN